MKKKSLIIGALIALNCTSLAEESLVQDKNVIILEGEQELLSVENLVAANEEDEFDEKFSTTVDRQDYIELIERSELELDEMEEINEVQKDIQRWTFGTGLNYIGRPGLNVTSDGNEIRLPGDFNHGTKHGYQWSIAKVNYKFDHGWSLDYHYRRNFYRNYGGENFERRPAEGRNRTDNEHNIFLAKDFGNFDFLNRSWNVRSSAGIRFLEEGNIHFNDGRSKAGNNAERYIFNLRTNTKLTDKLSLTLVNETHYRHLNIKDSNASDGSRNNNGYAYQVRNYFTPVLNYRFTDNLDFNFSNQLHYRTEKGSSLDERWQWIYSYRLRHVKKLNDEFSFETTLGTWGDYYFSRKGGPTHRHEKAEVNFLPKLIYNTTIFNDTKFQAYGGVGYVHGYDSHNIKTTGYHGLHINLGANITYRF